MQTWKRNALAILTFLTLLAVIVAPAFAAPGTTYLLLHFNGDDGSTTFIDQANLTSVWTAFGNAQIDTAQSVFGGASGLFDGTGDYITTDDDVRPGEGAGQNWTLDMRLRFNGDPGTANGGLIQQYQNTSNFWILRHNANSLDFIVRSAGANIITIQNAWNPAGDTWYHVAVVYQGSADAYRMFIDGVQIGTTQTDASVIPAFTGGLYVGRYTGSDASQNYHNGWIDELRIKNEANWLSDFTPPTQEHDPSPNNNATATAASYQTQTAAALTATAANYQTQTAAALTATAIYNLTATAADLTATEAYQQTAVAFYERTPTASSTPGPIGTAQYDGTITYGDLARWNSRACLGLVIALFVTTWGVASFLMKGRRSE